MEGRGGGGRGEGRGRGEGKGERVRQGYYNIHSENEGILFH